MSYPSVSKFIQAFTNFERLTYRLLGTHTITKVRYFRRSQRVQQDSFKPREATHKNYGLGRCKVKYINLIHREDRRREIEEEFQRLNFSPLSRFEAVKKNKGALGCTLSHKHLLTNADLEKNQILMVCEDDCQFLTNHITIDNLIEEFFLNPNLDVLCLAFSIPKTQSPHVISENLAVTSNIQTMACYVLKPYIIPEMIAIGEESEKKYAEGWEDVQAAIDQVWKKLQIKYIFAIPRARVAIQRPSFSDIENNMSNYGV